MINISDKRFILVDENDIKQSAYIDDNVSTDTINDCIVTAQELHLQRIIGSELYYKIINDALNDTLTDDYKTLIKGYIKPVIKYYTINEVCNATMFSIRNRGIVKEESDNTSNLNVNELRYLMDTIKGNALTFENRLITYLKKYSEKFPEYVDEDSDIKSDESENTSMFVNMRDIYNKW